MKILLYLLSFFYIVSCNDEDYFEPTYLDISIKSIHPIEIKFDFSTFDSQLIKLKDSYIQYFSTIKELLNNSGKLFNKFLKVENQKYISTNLEISSLCNQNIPLYDTAIKTGIKKDLIIYPIISTNKTYITEDLISGGICALDDSNLRPIIAYIKFNDGFNFNVKNSKDKFTILIMHQLTHILGFNKHMIKKLSKGKDNLFKLTRSEKRNFIAGKTLIQMTEIVYRKFYTTGLELYSDINGNLTGHWNQNMILNDYMKPYNYSENHITHLTLKLLNDLGWYSFIHSSCNLYKKIDGDYCVKLNDTCKFEESERVELYIKNGNLHCGVRLRRPNICINELNLFEEYKEKANITHLIKACKNDYSTYEREITISKFPELKRVKSQIVRVIKPSKYCQSPQRTIFFPYSPNVNIRQNITSTPIRVSNIKYMMVSLQEFDSKSKYSPSCLKETLNYAQFIRVYSAYENANLIWVNLPEKKYFNSKFSKYQRLNHFISHSQITRKDLLYQNFIRMKKNFSEDYNYMATTYILPKQYKKVKEDFENYVPKSNYLWLLKPSSSARGEGIKFMESFSDIPNHNKNHTILTRYIHNPDLLKGRKYDLRVYILVTGHQPLKIYVYDEGIVRIATEQYNLDVNDLNNLYKHLTNVALNKQSKNFKEDDKDNLENANIWSFTLLRNHFKKNGKDFDTLFKKIQDIAVKSIILMHDEEIKAERKREYELKSNNLFELYGMDILVDENLKPWLLEINLSPSLSGVGEYEQRIKSKLFSDMLNILGFIPFNHLNGRSIEKDFKFNNTIDEAIDDSICEFTRPIGGWIRSFPTKDNIEYFRKFFKNPIEENLGLWKKIIELNI